MRRRFHSPWAALLLLSLSGATAQNSAPPQNTPQNTPPPLQSRPSQPATPAPTANNRLVFMEVQVNDKSGTPVLGLQQQDFTILDDKLPQKIVAFQAVNHASPTPADPPIDVLLVIDSVNTSFQSVAFEQEQIRKFLSQNGGTLPYPTSLLVITDTGTLTIKDSTRDGNALAAAFEQYQTGLRTIRRSAGFYGASDRFDLSVRALGTLADQQAARPSRKLMIWFSPGWPLLSGPNVQVPPQTQRWLFNSIVGLSNVMRQAHITLYTIDPLGLADAGTVQLNYYQEFLKGVRSPARTVPGNLGLQVLAVQSGGEVFNASNDVLSAINHCVADANAFYILGFMERPADQANEYHALEVKVDKSGAKTRTRTGYYAQP